jgi:hypothetical protein
MPHAIEDLPNLIILSRLLLRTPKLWQCKCVGWNQPLHIQCKVFKFYIVRCAALIFICRKVENNVSEMYIFGTFTIVHLLSGNKLYIFLQIGQLKGYRFFQFSLLPMVYSRLLWWPSLSIFVCLSSMVYTSTQKMETACSSETSVNLDHMMSHTRRL